VRKSLWTIGLALAIPAVVSAQKVPRFEVFGGYSYGWINGYVANGSLLGSGTGTYPFPSFGSKGWTGSVAFNATRWFAVVADIGGLYAMPTRTISGMPITIACMSAATCSGRVSRTGSGDGPSSLMLWPARRTPRC